MEIPGKVSLYCPLVDAKGTPAVLVAISTDGYYHLHVSVKGQKHAMFVPIESAALLFSDPEPEAEPGLELER